MSGHTPGPWEWEDGEYVLWAQGGRKIIDTAPYEGMWIVAENEEANARLIAAAPDLLEALDNLYWLATENERLGVHKETYDKAQAAIAKATGQDNGWQTLPRMVLPDRHGHAEPWDVGADLGRIEICIQYLSFQILTPLFPPPLVCRHGKLLMRTISVIITRVARSLQPCFSRVADWRISVLLQKLA